MEVTSITTWDHRSKWRQSRCRRRINSAITAIRKRQAARRGANLRSRPSKDWWILDKPHSSIRMGRTRRAVTWAKIIYINCSKQQMLLFTRPSIISPKRARKRTPIWTRMWTFITEACDAQVWLHSREGLASHAFSLKVGVQVALLAPIQHRFCNLLRH